MAGSCSRSAIEARAIIIRYSSYLPITRRRAYSLATICPPEAHRTQCAVRFVIRSRNWWGSH
jgi:hypothetical protein